MLSLSWIQQFALLALIQCLCLSLPLVNALPLASRQDGSNFTMTVQTVHTLQTVAGPMTETCVVTLTPITDSKGQPAVEEVRTCKISMDSGGGGGSNSGSGGSSSTSVVTTTSVISQSTSSNSAATSTSTTASTTAQTSAATSNAASTTLGPAPSSNGAVRVNGVSTVPASAVATPPPSSSSTSASASAASAGSTTTTPAAASTTSPAASAAADAAASSGSAAAASASPASFTLPGKQLSVLPIGLGVFAGISVIALIVVGLVTYERTKYRKAFRQRKLAESGAAMGYGGMAQR